MDRLYWIAIAAGVVIALIGLWVLSRPRFRRDMPFSRRPALLSAGERAFYTSLRRCIPPGVSVFPKVRLMDIISVPEDAWRKYGAPGSGMHVDFVLADTTTTQVLLIIELDDRTHKLPTTSVRDAFKDAALASAKIPLMRVIAAARYDESDVSTRVTKLLAERTAAG